MLAPPKSFEQSIIDASNAVNEVNPVVADEDWGDFEG